MKHTKFAMLSIVAVPIVLHELFHGLTDERSVFYILHPLMDWITPLFEDENLVAGHVLTNTASLTFIALSLYWVADYKTKWCKKIWRIGN